MNNIPKEIKKFYHCTTQEKMIDILCEGLKTGCDGVVYLADSPENAAKFIAIRGVPIEDLRVITISRDDLKEELLDYSYDHSESFFKCKGYQYSEKIINFIEDEIYSFGK